MPQRSIRINTIPCRIADILEADGLESARILVQDVRGVRGVVVPITLKNLDLSTAKTSLCCALRIQLACIHDLWWFVAFGLGGRQEEISGGAEEG